MSSMLKKSAMVSLLLPVWVAASGCGGGGGSGTASSSSSVSGMVIDGPVSGSTITIKDSAGNAVTTTTSGSDAKYTVSIPSGVVYPLRVSISGGTDLVSGETPMGMESLVTDATQSTANVTPITSMMYYAALSGAGGDLSKVTSAIVKTAKTNVISQFGFGTDSEDSSFDPVSSTISSSNVTSVMMAAEAMAETLRRAVGTDSADITKAFAALGEDMVDGSMDGKKSGAALSNTLPTGFSATTLVSSMTQQKALVGAEVVGNSLKVTKKDGTQLTSDEVKTKVSQAINKVDATVTADSALTKMSNLTVSSNMKSQWSSDVSNAITVQTNLGVDTTAMTALKTTASSLETGKSGASQVTSTVIGNVETSVKTAAIEVKKEANLDKLTTAVSSLTAPSTSVTTSTSTSTSTSTPASTGPSNAISGSMSAGALINTDVVVTMKDKDGDSITCTTTGASYSCDISQMPTPNPPYFIKVQGKAGNKEYTLYSVAHKSGKANVNPMTNLVLSNAMGGDPGAVFKDPGNSTYADKVAKVDTEGELSTKVEQFKENFLKTLENQGYAGANVDPFDVDISEGTGLDKVFDGMEISVNAAGGYQVLDKMKLATKGKADAMVLSGNVATFDPANTTIDTSKLSSGSQDFSDPTIQKQLAHALTLGTNVSVVDNKSDETTAPATNQRARSRSLRAASADEMALINPVSDFYQDETIFHVHEKSGEALSTINEILCAVDQTRYDQMLNQGPYKAQIDWKQCQSSKDDPSSQGQSGQNTSSGSGAPEFGNWIVDSQRASNADPQIVKVWAYENKDKGGGGTEGSSSGSLIYAYSKIQKGASENNPYGIFTMDFKGVNLSADGSPGPEEMMRGFLNVGERDDKRITLTFMDQESHGAETLGKKVVLVRTPDGKAGTGSVNFVEPQWDEASQKPVNLQHTFHFSFDEDWFLRRDAESGKNTCLSRNHYKEDIWRYGLYHLSNPTAGSDKTWKPGDRVVRDSGFPVRYMDTNGKDWHGWVGYWGTWFPSEVVIPSGASLKKQVFNREGVQEADYTFVQAGGKLMRHTKNTVTLAELKNIPLKYSEDGAIPGMRTEYQVEWDGSSFVKVGQLNQTSFFWEKLTTSSSIDLSKLMWDGVQFWSDALGGNVRVKLDGCVNSKKAQWQEVDQLNQVGSTAQAQVKEQALIADHTPETWDCSGKASDTVKAIFHRQEMVQPGSAAYTSLPTALLCGQNCPDPTAMSATEGSSPFFTDKNMGGVPTGGDVSSNFFTYGFDKNAMVLQYGGTNVVTTASNAQFQWGIHSGPLFENSAANLDALKCEWDSSFVCPWQAWDKLDTFYTWETGPNDWNKFSALKDASGTFLRFDPPLMVTYEHQWTAADTAKYNLEYAGFGSLNGIPGRCVGHDSDEDVACGPQTRWVPDFSISTGTVVSDKDGNTYLVKGLDVEERMIKDDSGCTNLSIEEQSLPTSVTWTDDTDPATRLGASGALTNLPEAPAVISGTLQDE
ncbi:MAG: hypothetical protein HQL75_07515 [Magnetococcales bacterium]|nr:hypothetical protein [Magnetococcales bacterium]